jgi:hypothetical protein
MGCLVAAFYSRIDGFIVLYSLLADVHDAYAAYAAYVAYATHIAYALIIVAVTIHSDGMSLYILDGHCV